MIAAIQLKNFISIDWNLENSLITENLKRNIVNNMLQLYNMYADDKIGKILLVVIEVMSKDKLQYEWKEMLIFVNN